MARNSEFFLGDSFIDVIKLGDDDIKIYLQDTLIYQPRISIGTATVTCNVATYNGNPQSATTIQVTLSGNQLTLNEDFIVTSNTGGTNVGSYNVTVQGIGLYKGNASGTFTINKVTPTVVAPTAKTNLVYNGNSQALVTAGSTNWGTLKYSLDGSTYSTSIPSGTNATSYTVYYKVDGDSNINSVAAKTVSVSIAKADPSYTAPTAKSLTYNTSAQALLNAGSTSDGTIQYSSDNSSWSTTIPTGTNANTYTSYWRIVGDSNHNDKVSTSISTTISPKTVNSPTITLSPTSYTYNGSACQPTPTVKDGSVTINTSEYTISYNNNTNAGTATCVISDKSGGNYVISGSKTFTIEKVTPTVTAPTPKTLTYNTSAQVLATNGSTNWGTIQYCLDNSGGTYSTTVPSATNANVTYKVWYKVVGDSNINDVSPQSIDCMIAEKRVTTPTITLSPSSYTYSGSECKPTPTVKDGSVVIPSSEYATSYINNLNAGTATVTISDNTAGNYYISGTTTFTINKAAGSVTTKPTSKSLTYNNTSQQLVTAGSGTGTMQYKLGSGSWGTSIPTSTNAGDYTVYYKASASTNYNESASGSVSVTINKVTPTVSAPTAKSLTYNGTSQQLATAGSTNYGTLKYSLDNSTWSTTVPSGTNATTYTVYYKVDGDSNINSVASQSISVTISKANQSAPTATVTTATYPGTSTASASGGGGVGTLTWTNGNSRTAIGIQDTYAYWSGNSNYNASPNSNKVRLSVATYTPTLTLSVTNRAYNGNPLYATASVARPSGGKLIKGIIYYGTSSGARTYSVTYNSDSGSASLSSVSITNVGSATVYAYFTPDTSCNDVYNNSGNASKTFSVSKAAMTHTAPKAAVRTYNGSAQQIVSGQSAGGGSIYYATSSAGASSSTTVPTATNTGTTYSTYWKAVPDSNHSGGTSTWAKITGCKINKAALTITAKAQTVNYGTAITTGTGQVTTSGLVGGDSLTSITLTPSTSNVPGGTITPSAGATTKGIGNYSVTYKTGTLTINKVAMTYTAPSAATRTYNTSAQQIVSGQSAAGGSIYYATSSAGASSSTTVPTQTNVGTYSTYWKAVPDGNHSGGTSSWAQISNCKINAKTVSNPTITLNPSAYTYNGSACQPTPTVKDGSTTIASSEYTVSYSNNTNAGTATCTITDKSGGNYTVSGSKTFTISKKTNCAISFGTTAVTKTYGNAAFTNAITNSGDGTITWGSSNTTIATVNSSGKVTIKQAGSCTISATTTSTNNCTYSTTAASYTLTVNKASGSVTTKPTAKSLTWTGSAQSLVNAGSGTGTMLYKLGSGSWGTSIPTATNATSYKVYYKASASTNYNESASGSVSCSIKQVAMSYTAPKAAVRTYNGSAQQIVSGGSANGGSIYYATSSAGASSSTTVPTQTNASTTYSTWWKAVPDSNHSGGTSSWTQITGCTINKANQSAPTATGATTTYPTTATATASGGGEQGSIEWSNGNTQTSVGSKTTKARWSGNGNYNASDWSNEVTLTVQGTSTITIKNPNTVYAITMVYKAYYSGSYHETSNIYIGPSSSAKITLNDNNITWILYFSDAYTINNSSGARTSASVTSSITSANDPTTINATVSKTSITLKKAF